MRDRVVVIGAGMGGLAAAVRLAHAGCDVTVVDGATEAGGKAGTVRVDGVSIDTGPSVVTMTDVLDDVVRAARADPRDHLVWRAMSPGFRYVYPDGVVLDVHTDLDATLASVGDTLGFEARRELVDFLAYAGRIWDAAAPAFVLGDAPTVLSTLRLPWAQLAGLRAIDATRSMRAAIAARVRNEPLRWLLWRYATYNGSDVRQAPATLNCIAHVELSLGGFGVEGGLQHLVRTFVTLAEKGGATFRLGVAATRIVVEGGRAVAVALADGTSLPADAVVANADAAQVRDVLLADAGPRPIPTAATSMSAWTGVVRARRTDRAPHTVVFPDDYGREMEDLFDLGAPPAAPTVYLSAQERCHGIPAWDDAEPVFVMTNAPAVSATRRPVDWPSYAAGVLARAAQRGQLHDADKLVWSRTPTELAQRFAGSDGSLYGAASHGWTSAFRRPPNRLAHPTGTYLASGSAHPGGGVPMAVLSGTAAARQLLADRGILSTREAS